MKKEIIVQTLLSNQNQVILDLKERVLETKTAGDIDEDDTLGPEDFSHQNQYNEMNKLIKNQLVKAENDLNKLLSIDFNSKEQIEIGSIVTTDKFSFIIGVATFPFNIDGRQYVGISVEAPIYSMMLNKTEGEMFSYANNEYKIVSIN